VQYFINRLVAKLFLKYAFLRNATTGSIVKTTYVDVLTSMQAARDVMSGNLDPTFPVSRVIQSEC
jgi:hypothetical protein